MHHAARLPKKSLNILIYGLNYAPEIIGVGRYTSEIGEYLSSKSHNVLVVTAPPHYPEWSVGRPYHALRYTSEMRHGALVIRCPILLRSKIFGIWRLIAPLSFAFSSAPVVLWAMLRHRPDVVFCVEPTLLAAPAALIVAKFIRAKTVLHVHDLEVDAAFAVGHLTSGVAQRIGHYFERCVLLGFDQIISISTKMCERLVSKGVLPGQITLIRNWADLDRIRPLNSRNPIRSQLGLSEETFVVLYSGSVGAKQAIHMLLDAAERIAEEKKSVAFVIAGEGPEKRYLIERYGYLPNVHFLPLQPEDQLCELLNLADLHVLPQATGVADFVLPSKLGGLLASGKPLLVTANPETELYELLHGTAIIVPTGDTDAMVKEIVQIAAKSPRPTLSECEKLAKLFSKKDCLQQLMLVLLAER
jgi:colanic acid biosynthesis glycosyl transferase WcaI